MGIFNPCFIMQISSLGTTFASYAPFRRAECTTSIIHSARLMCKFYFSGVGVYFRRNSSRASRGMRICRPMRTLRSQKPLQHQMGALHPLTSKAVSGPFPQEQGLTMSRKPCCYALFTACLYACLSLLVQGQYEAVWGLSDPAPTSDRRHHAAELGCGRLRRCPVIRPATDR